MRAVKYYIGNDVYISDRNPDSDGSEKSWAIEYKGLLVDKNFGLNYEPQPSSRDEDFYNRCRFLKKEAESLAKWFLNEVAKK